MSEIIINGGNKLTGSIKIQGAKNSVLPLLAATILCDGKSVIHNCPNLSDVETSLKILANLGCICTTEGNTITVDSSNVTNYEIPDTLMREMRSSVVFLGAIIGKTGKAVISSPGGCELGPRPIDLHLSALNRMGVTVKEEHGLLFCSAEDGLKGTEINLTFPSVGATENVILAAATAKGITIIHNAAKEPEISDLADFLNKAGAKIYGGGSDTIKIYGVEKLNGSIHNVIPDRIAATTYMAAAAVTGGKITIENTAPSHLVSVLWFFRECGCEIILNEKNITIIAPRRINRVPKIISLIYPGFPTDAGPIAVSMLSVAKGTSVFSENIFENRFRYIDEFNRFGAKIKTEGKAAIIEGVAGLSAADCKCTDLRGGAALVIGALAAEGRSKISEIHHINRGYENITENLKKLGADITLVK